jgi:2-desacetyl-2-hydroxyethyl bacteriochlorophyllide A dehydrogenase
MKALVFDGTLRLASVPVPAATKDEVLIRVTLAGICNTDHEIVAGYMPGFKGILGHEFLGIVEKAGDKKLAGKRVTAEINCGCGTCEYCKNGMERHCPNRTVIGIKDRDGAFAEYICVPAKNVVTIPDSVPDASAVFIEPLAAALEIKEQVSLEHKNVLLIGDGKLGILIAHVLSTANCEATAIGNHQEKLGMIGKLGVKTMLSNQFQRKQFDIVVEASGNPDAFSLAVECTKPHGTLVLKSTYARDLTFNPSPFVVNEITVVGSRCGRFSDALQYLELYKPDFSWMISKEFSIEDGMEAFEYSKKPWVLKVILKM